MHIIIATRESQLALWQAEWVKAQLELHPNVEEVKLLPLVSRGDKILDAPLAKVGGKGLFVKELEEAMLAGTADIAVHSMKDVPMAFPSGLMLAAVLERASAFDAFVSNDYKTIDDLPEGAVVGTSSLRRQAQLLKLRPDLKIRFLRGNVNTRLRKLDDGDYQAIILAEAGLRRLGFDHRVSDAISARQMLPAAGQGAVGIEIRQPSTARDHAIHEVIASLHHRTTALCVQAERGVITELNGGCQVPIGAYCVNESSEDLRETLSLRALVADSEGSNIIEVSCASTIAEELDAFAMGQSAAKELIAKGADQILKEYGIEV